MKMIVLDKIHNMDCIEYMKQLPDECIDLIVTEPPYLMNYRTKYRQNKDHRFCKPISKQATALL
nr:MAG TPA: adenine-specific methyltransferase [Caudoviricetes sp.]